MCTSFSFLSEFCKTTSKITIQSSLKMKFLPIAVIITEWILCKKKQTQNFSWVTQVATWSLKEWFDILEKVYLLSLIDTTFLSVQ